MYRDEGHMRLVFNPTSLIYLAKAGPLPLLKDIKCEKLITEGVKTEVVDKGKEKAAKDALIIERALQDGTLKIGKVKNEGLLHMLSKIPELHPADAEVLALAKEVGGIAVVDDRVARDTAKVYGIEHGGTAFILATLIARGLITKEKAKLALDDMISSGWRCSAEQYSKIIRTIEGA
jgi:predicted nucleic acid-binding protein